MKNIFLLVGFLISLIVIGCGTAKLPYQLTNGNFNDVTSSGTYESTKTTTTYNDWKCELNGRILYTDGTPVKGCKVICDYYHKETVTDDNGNYKITFEQDYSYENEEEFTIKVSMGSLTQSKKILFKNRETKTENFTFQAIETLQNGVEKKGYIKEKGYSDLFKITANAGQVMKITLSRATADFQPFVEVYNTANTKMNWTVGQWNANPLVSWTGVNEGILINTSDTYYFNVSDYGDNQYSTTVPYVLTVELY